jgi:hypothetical protein
MVEANTAGSCTSKCCDTEVVSEVSSSSSEHTHASHHAHSRPSFETLPPGARTEIDAPVRDKVNTK